MTSAARDPRQKSGSASVSESGSKKLIKTTPIPTPDPDNAVPANSSGAQPAKAKSTTKSPPGWPESPVKQPEDFFS
jgi:hypothetical protein